MFWLLGVPVFAVGVGLALYAASAAPNTSKAALALLNYLQGFGLILMAASAIHGLRVTWSLSRWKALVIVLPWFASNLIQAVEVFTIYGPTPHAYDDLYGALSITPSWILAAVVAQHTWRRFAPPGDIPSIRIADPTDRGDLTVGLRRTNVPEVLLLTLVTLGLYYPIWFLRRRRGLNELASPTKLKRWPFVVGIVVISTRLLLSSVLETAQGVDPTGVQRVLALLIGLSQFAIGIVMIIQQFHVKSIIEDDLAGSPENAPLQRVSYASTSLSGLLTFFLGIFYLQHVINTRIVHRPIAA